MSLLLCSCVLVLLVSGYCREEGGTLLYRTLDALTRGLQYMQDEIPELNVDAVFCIRRVQEQLQAFLIYQPDVFQSVRHWLEVLRDKSKKIADQGKLSANEKEANYVAKVGIMIDESKKLIWYPSRNTSVAFAELPVPCSSYYYDAMAENRCYHELSGRGDNETNPCGISSFCTKLNSRHHNRAYALTHQILYWEAAEANQCKNPLPVERHLLLCSNVMRDANLTSAANYPKRDEDLFMEQIGLCGIWGFQDFNKRDWLEKILEWQKPSGCYKDMDFYRCYDEVEPDAHVRVKRNEKEMSGGCLAHKTAVALLALVVNVRFEAEKVYLKMNRNENRLNKLLV